MKKSVPYFLLFLLFSCVAFSQQERVSGFNSLNSEAERLNVLSHMDFNRFNLERSSLNQQNEILIQQIGYNNTVFSQTQSQSSKIELLQNGDFNSVYLDVNAPRIDAKIIQNGDSNLITDNIYYSNLDVKLNALQNGNNLSINRIGVNSLSNKLQLIQEGSFRTITVISN